MTSTPHAQLRHLALLILFPAAVILIVTLFIPINRLTAILSTADYSFLLLAAATVFIARMLDAYILQTILRQMGHVIPFWKAFESLLAAFFVNTALPSLGLSGALLLNRRLKSYDISQEASTHSIILIKIANTAASLLLMFTGYLSLLLLGDLTGHQRITSSAVTLGTTLLILLITYIILKETRLKTVLTHLRTLGGAKTTKAKRKARSLATAINNTLQHIRDEPRKQVVPILLSLLKQFVYAVCVYLLFLALGHPTALSTAVIGYVFASLIAGASLLPGGVGSFEVAMTAAFAGMDLPIDIVIAVTALFRLLTFWLPLLAGMIMAKNDIASIKDMLT